MRNAEKQDAFLQFTHSFNIWIKGKERKSKESKESHAQATEIFKLMLLISNYGDCKIMNLEQ